MMFCPDDRNNEETDDTTENDTINDDLGIYTPGLTQGDED